MALAERGRWTMAEVVDKEDAKTDLCTLRRADGEDVSPALSEGDGCELASVGETLRVRYDPEGVAGPVTSAESDAHGGLLAGLVVAAVGMGTWGSVRMSRWDRAHVTA